MELVYLEFNGILMDESMEQRFYYFILDTRPSIRKSRNDSTRKLLSSLSETYKLGTPVIFSFLFSRGRRSIFFFFLFVFPFMSSLIIIRESTNWDWISNFCKYLQFLIGNHTIRFFKVYWTWVNVCEVFLFYDSFWLILEKFLKESFFPSLTYSRWTYANFSKKWKRVWQLLYTFTSIFFYF